MTTPKYFTIEELISFIDEPNRTACMNILTENRALFEIARGSTHNHQTRIGGWEDFSSISNGSISRMWGREKETDVKLEEIINTKEKFQNYISKLIIQVFFKELSQLEEVNPEDGIEFLIEW